MNEIIHIGNTLTAPKCYFAFFVVVKDDGFNGRLPFKEKLVEVEPYLARVPKLFAQAIATAQGEKFPSAGAECDLCRWHAEVTDTVGKL